MTKRSRHGFSAVELLIAIIVGIVFLGGISQMYTVVVNDAAAARNRANASAIAYTEARSMINGRVTPCSASSATKSLAGTSLPSPVSLVTTVDCPYTATYSNNAILRLTVTLTYGTGTSQGKVQHVLYKN